jgi:hypothetical protein
MKKYLLILLLLFAVNIAEAQSVERNADPFIVFDGMFYPGNLDMFTWGQSSLMVEWGEGSTAGTNSLTWIQGDEWGNGWTGAGYNIVAPVDLSAAWTEDSIKLKMKAPSGTGPMRLQFESGSDGKVGLTFNPTDDDQWHEYSFALSDFVPQDGTTNFNPAAVIVFQIMAEASGQAGRVIYMDDIWTGNASAPTYNLPIIVDGDVSDANYMTLASWDGADNWGSSNDLGEIKFYADGTQLYIGIAGKVEENWNKLALFIDFSDYNGIPAGTPLPGGGVPGFFQDGGIGGSTLNMELDFAMIWTTDPSFPFYCDAARYDATSVVAGDGIGNSNKQGNPFTMNSARLESILGGSNATGLQAYKNTFDRATNPNDGLEVCLDISAFQDITSANQVRFFVALVNADGNYWSNEFLPDYYNSTGGASGPFANDFGADPDLNTAATGASVSLYTQMSPVPVELGSFSAVTEGNSILLKWETVTETNNQGFEIQRGGSDSEFLSVGFMPGYGTTTERKTYNYTDANLAPGTYYYRLKQVDHDGTESYSNVIEVDLIKPLEFSLDQNYPNPFNPSTKINFSIPENGFVKLTVYNLIGEKVSELLNGHTEAGTHTLTFNAKNLNSGIYIYKLSYGDLLLTRKMVLIK